MPQIGCLGEVVFEVSESAIKTIRNVSWSGSATIQTHQRHLQNALTEYTGTPPDAIEFKLRLSYFLGADPLADIAKLFEYERTGKAVPLTIGNKCYGKYRWLVKSHKIAMEHFDGDGNLLGSDVTVSLTEYLKE